MPNANAPKSLPPSFHQSFMPERRHLSSLLALAARQFTGTLEVISEATGIPTGKSSGKVLPHLRYAECMGMLVVRADGNGIYTINITPLGSLIVAEDPLLHEAVTQLILHLMLSRPCGASVWHALFGRSRVALGRQFSPEAATTYLTAELGNSTSIPGPLFSTYREESSLARTGVLNVEKAQLSRSPLPLVSEYFFGYAYCWLRSWEELAPHDQQKPTNELEQMTRFEEMTGWTASQFESFLSWCSDHHIIRVDRQTGVPLIMKLATSNEVISKIYSELL